MAKRSQQLRASLGIITTLVIVGVVVLLAVSMHT